MLLVQKWPLFKLFFLSNKSQENVYYDILERKNAFLRYKKQEVQKVEKLTFFLRGCTMVLVQKLPFFQVFLFRQYRPGKCVLRYSRMKKRLSRL